MITVFFYVLILFVSVYVWTAAKPGTGEHCVEPNVTELFTFLLLNK